MQEFNFAFLLENTLNKRYDELEELFMTSESQPLFGQSNGTYFADYTIEAKTLKGAVGVAKKEIKGFGVSVLRITPEPYVTASDIAKRVSVSKEAIRKIILGHTNNKTHFPSCSMILGENKPIWNWAVVAKWMYDTGRIKDIFTVRQAKDIYFLNKEIEAELF